MPALDQIGWEQIRCVRAATPSAVSGTSLAAAVVAYAAWDALPFHVLQLWAGSLLLACALAIADWSRSHTRHETLTLAICKVSGVGVAMALPWGFLATFALGPLPHAAETILLCLLGAMASSGSIHRAPVYPAALAYACVLVMPLGVACALSGRMCEPLALLVVVFLAFLPMMISTCARLSIERSQGDRLARDLIDNLQGAVTMLDERNAVMMLRDDIFTILRVPVAEQPAALTDFASYLRTQTALPLADTQAREQFDGFLSDMRERRPATRHVELEDQSALAFIGQPGRNGTYAVIIKDSTPTFRVAKALEHRARHDALTGLLNRAALHAELASLLKCKRDSDRQFTLLALDLDKFKQANDTYGHLAGDTVLAAVARRLKEATRTGDVIARPGGDEFSVILKGPLDVTELQMITHRIKELVEQPIAVGEDRVRVGISIGVAVAGRDGTTAEELIQNADRALYCSKRSRAPCGYHGGARPVDCRTCLGDRMLDAPPAPAASAGQVRDAAEATAKAKPWRLLMAAPSRL